jgi:hypothetical protein
VVLLLIAVAGVAVGIYILVNQSIVISAFGLPVEVKGLGAVVLGALFFLPAVLLGVLFWNIAAAPSAGRVPVGWSADTRFGEVTRLADRGRKLEAIQALRALTGAGLAEATGAVDAYLFSRS